MNRLDVELRFTFRSCQKINFIYIEVSSFDHKFSKLSDSSNFESEESQSENEESHYLGTYDP